MTIDSANEAVQFAKAYLAAMEARDLTAASRYLAADAQLFFPGGVKRDGVIDIARGSASRYRRIGKADHVWEAFKTDDRWVVYCRGTLHGEWPDGTPFSGIRFIDRFEIDASGIRRQDVWNEDRKSVV